jgi:hypothetical protein
VSYDYYRVITPRHFHFRCNARTYPALLLLSDDLTVFLAALDVYTTLVLEALESSHADVDLEDAAGKLVHALATRAARATCAGDDEVFARETRTRGLLRGDFDFANNVTAGRDFENVASAMKRSPHVALFVDAMAVRHGVFAVAVVLWHDEERALVAYRAGLGVKVELENRLGGTVGPVHFVVVLVPCRAVGDGDVAERAVKGAVGVEAEERAVLVPFGDEGVEHEARPETSLRVDSAVITAVLFVLVGADFFGAPDAFDPAVFACLLVGDAVAILAGKGELVGVALNVGCAAVHGQYMAVFCKESRHTLLRCQTL